MTTERASMISSIPCRVVKFETPEDHYLLNGLLYGGDSARRGFIFIHGLTGEAFSHNDILSPLASEDTAVLYFSNRGYNLVADIKRLDHDTDKGYRHDTIGTAHEIFIDCIDDINGAINFLGQRGVEQFYLVGHSTGCQKITYYLSQPGTDPRIKGGVLICPMSDYAYAAKTENPAILKRATAAAEHLVASGQPHQLLSPAVWPELLDAQRFLSLYAADSPEEIFTYAQPHKAPTTLQAVKTPLLIELAGADEYADRPASDLVTWFEQATRQQTATVQVMEGSLHNLAGHEATLARNIARWAK